MKTVLSMLSVPDLIGSLIAMMHANKEKLYKKNNVYSYLLIMCEKEGLPALEKGLLPTQNSDERNF